MGREKKDDIEIGKSIGYLKVIKEVEPLVAPCGQKRRAFLCRCECGKEVVRSRQALIASKAASCGCHSHDWAKKKAPPQKDIMDESIFRIVCQQYLRGYSLRAIAESNEISTNKVARILVVHGLYENETSQKVSKLAKEGLSTKEIAEKLKVNPSTVAGYLDYQIGVHFSDNPREGAIRLRKWKNKEAGRNTKRKLAGLTYIRDEKGKWRVNIKGKNYGAFSTIEEAKKVRDKALAEEKNEEIN